MVKSKFPKRIEAMIITSYYKGHSAATIAKRINNSITAKKLNVEYSHRSIAAKLANITRS